MLIVCWKDLETVEFSEAMKEMQTNWIGKAMEPK